MFIFYRIKNVKNHANKTLLDRKNILQSELRRISQVIIQNYFPEKIILFGSLASGNIHEWSDIDLVIIKKTNERFIKRLHDVAFLTHPEVGVNFLVYTPSEFQEMISDDNYFVVDEILKKGRILYEK